MAADIRYDQWDPPTALGGTVRCVWALKGRADGTTQPIVSDGCVELVLNLADPFEHVRAHGAVVQPLLMVVGPTARPTIVRPTGVIDIIGIRLQPWASARVLGVSMRTLRDRYLPLGDVVRGPLGELAGRLRVQPGDEMRLATVFDALARTLPALEPGIAQRAVEFVSSATEVPSVRALANQLGCSARTVQRVFADHVGLTPKTLLRVVRVQRALGMALGEPSTRWSMIAARAGYHDQSHFVRDFRSLVGCSPSQFRPDEDSLTATFVEVPAS